MTVISWFSCGVTSAVATKMALNKYGTKSVLPIYFKINQVHPDNDRFIAECEQWFGVKIKQIQGEFKTPIEVALQTRYVNGPSGARCTYELKRKLRQTVEKDTFYSAQVFGFEYSKREELRAKRFVEQYPLTLPQFPLIKAKMNKAACLYLLEKVGIKRPEMYNLGYHNNNCIGCFKGGMGYWNKIRKDFPDIFKATAEMEREIGATCIKGQFLDELNPNAGHSLDVILPDCGNFCDIEYLPSDYEILNS